MQHVVLGSADASYSMKVDWPLKIISVDLNHDRDRKSCERERHVDHDAFAHSWKARIKSMLLTGSGAAQRREMQRRRAAGAIHLNAMSFAIHLNAMRRSWRCIPLECDRRSWQRNPFECEEVMNDSSGKA